MTDPRPRMQRLAARYGEAAEGLARVVREIEAVRDAAVRERLPDLQREAKRTEAARRHLLELVAQHPESFARPRSQQIAGVKFGWRKLAGRIELGPRALELARKLQPQLVRRVESLDKQAAKKLSAKELAAIGGSLVASTDSPFAEVAASDVELAAAALLSRAEAEDGGDG